MPLLALFILVVFAEIATFIAVGKAIGVLATLALLALSLVGGLMLVRVLGLDALRRAEASLARGESPAGAVFDAACVALAGVLLALPGFLSDIVALCLLLRPLRQWMGSILWRRLQAAPNVRVWTHQSGATVVEGDYVEIVEGRVLSPPRPGRGDDVTR
ncbi:MAG: FxsA family protein [Alphaproteobacteria bacterium]|nr:FxsA family protein [Alphaproteobacteria bacterium]